jgi:hypothetical protein
MQENTNNKTEYQPDTLIVRLMRWLGGANTPTPEVILIMYDERLKIVEAHKTQSGYMARWIDLNDQWSLLNKDGTATGCNLVKKWKPYKNCSNEMFASA